MSIHTPNADNVTLATRFMSLSAIPFVDLQVNGYGGVDFNTDGLTEDGLHRACAALEGDGVVECLATIITDDLPLMCGRLRRLAALRAADPQAERLIAGIHIEGPFLNEADGFRGAHPRDAIRPASLADMERLLDAAEGLTRVVTLAPERDAHLTVTRALADRRIVVSAGHCDPTLDELRAAADAGLSMCTHVGNGCPMQLHRHDNVIQRMLSLSDRLWLCFIADGVHVPFVALGNYLKLAGPEHCIVVTDAIAAAGLGPGRYRLGRWDLDIGDDMVARSPDRSHFVGSAVTMRQSAANLHDALSLPDSTIRQVTSENPRKVFRPGV
jgi:N-acetylglucosamine-6-phosphate deacetylase